MPGHCEQPTDLNRTEEEPGLNPARYTCTGCKNRPGQNKSFGPRAQLGARLNGIEKVEGSNPSGSTGKE